MAEMCKVNVIGQSRAVHAQRFGEHQLHGFCQELPVTDRSVFVLGFRVRKKESGANNANRRH